MQTSHAYVVRTHAQAHVRTQHAPCNPPPPPPRSQANGGCTLRAFRRRRPPRSQADGGCTLRAFRRRRPLGPRRMGVAVPGGWGVHARPDPPSKAKQQHVRVVGTRRVDASRANVGVPDQVHLRIPKGKNVDFQNGIKTRGRREHFV